MLNGKMIISLYYSARLKRNRWEKNKLTFKENILEESEYFVIIKDHHNRSDSVPEIHHGKDDFQEIKESS